ncbi:hypothetical protein JOF55_002269 [Haloactinomyces albus]|uniref:Uncharacterized protein n=1 Tax=Haloactinomyces albus TaxID=1352928 RepID=A0AAE3ZBW9_9ACTN|nr:hypothetical protein [Haloactinomyces albus]
MMRSLTSWVPGETQGQVHLGQTGTLALRMHKTDQQSVMTSTS